MSAGHFRFLYERGYIISAWACRRAGDEAGFALNMQLAEEARTQSLALGPPVAIADRRRDPPATTESSAAVDPTLAPPCDVTVGEESTGEH